MSAYQFMVEVRADDQAEAYRILGKALADAAMGGAGRMPPANQIGIKMAPGVHEALMAKITERQETP